MIGANANHKRYPEYHVWWGEKLLNPLIGLGGQFNFVSRPRVRNDVITGQDGFSLKFEAIEINW